MRIRVLLNSRYPEDFPIITCLSLRHRFQKAPFSKCFQSTLKRKPGVFKFNRFEKDFFESFEFVFGRNFLRIDSVADRPNRRNKTCRFEFLPCIVDRASERSSGGPYVIQLFIGLN